MRRHAFDLFVIIILITLTWVAFAPVLSKDFDFVNYDDEDYVLKNDEVRAGLFRKGVHLQEYPGPSWIPDAVRWSFTTMEAANWHPLTWLSLQLDAQIYGIQSAGFHRTNLLLHTAAAILFYLALRLMTNR